MVTVKLAMTLVPSSLEPYCEATVNKWGMKTVNEHSLD